MERTFYEIMREGSIGIRRGGSDPERESLAGGFEKYGWKTEKQ